MTTIHTLEIHCTVERLGPEYADGFVHATISLSPTLTATGGALDLTVADTFVKPWRWDWKRLAIFAVGGAAPARVAEAETVLWPRAGVTGERADTTNPFVGNLITVVEADYTRLRADARAAELLGNPPQVNGTNLGASVSSDNPAARPLVPWRLTLAGLWGAPQPAPQIINLTRFFRLPAATVAALLAAGRTGLVAAPVFVGHPFVADGRTYEPERVTQEADGRYRLAYPAGPVPVVVAFASATGLARPEDDASSMIKLSTLTSADPAGRLRLTGDLGAHLTDLLAEVHDMPELLLEWLAHVLNSNGSADVRAVDASFRRAFIASLRDVVHTGVRPSANGEAPYALIARQISQRLVEGTGEQPSPVPAALPMALDAFEASVALAAWEELSAVVLVERLSLLVPERSTPSAIVFPLLPEDTSGEEPDAYRDRLTQLARTLHATYDGLRTTEALAALVERQWTLAVRAAANAELTAWWERARARGVVAGVLAELNLRRLLARSSSGPASLAFPRLSGSGGASLDDRPSLELLVFDVLKNYVTGRFDTPINNPYETYRPAAARPRTLQDAGLNSFLRGRAAAFVRDRIVAAFAPDDLATAELPGSQRATTLAETLTFLVAGTKANSRNDAAADAADPLRRISGAGVLLGRPGRPWRCLNFGLPVTARGPLALGGAVNSVVALGYRNGLRQSVIEYRNEPLLGTNPLADSYLNVGLVPENGAGGLSPYITYECAYGTRAGLTPPLFLEPLIYGEQYHAVVYLASTSGALPASLAETVTETDATGVVRRVTLPWKFVLPTRNVGEATFEPQAERSGAALKFVRRVPVGLLTPAGGAGRSFPSPPKNVYPVARVLNGTRDESLLLLVPCRAATPDGTEQPADGWQGPEFAKHELTLLPPSVDIKVWERWTQNDPNHPNIDFTFRRDIIAAHLDAVDLDPDKEGVSDARARADDPPVKSLRVEAERLWPPPLGATPVTLFTRDFPPPPVNASDLGRVRSPGIPLRVTATGPSTVNNQTIGHEPPSGTDPAHKIRVPVGEVWRLHFRPVLFDGSAARFALAALTSAGEPLKVLTMVAETAAPLRRAGEADPAGQIHKALHVSRDASNPAALRVRLQSDASSRALFTRVHRIEAYAQRWRWDGRPLVFDPEPGASTSLAGFPFERWLADTDRGSGLEEFDGALFGDRSSEDALITNCQVEFVPADGVTPVGEQPLYEQRLGADAGALYFRFAARVYSRYEGLLTAATAIDSREPEPATNNEIKPERWVRHVVPCRHAGEVPRPRVKLLIPLYAAAPADPSPGLLVVLDEPAYADGLAGLAERIEAAVDTVTPPGAEEPLAQLGPDPVIFATGAAVGATSLTDRPLLGPVGFTFDTDSSAPLFVKAAYFWRSPLVDGLPVDLANHFVRLRLRRTINPKGYEDPTRRPESLVSEWTQGAWSRVLAPADRFAAETQGTRELVTVSLRDLVYSRAARSFARRDRRDELLDLLPTASDPDSRLSFTLFAVLTRSVPDALGRKDATAATVFLPVLSIADSPELAAAANITVIEIMHEQSFQLTAQNIVEALIPSETPPDVVSPATDLWESGTPRAVVVRVGPAVLIV